MTGCERSFLHASVPHPLGVRLPFFRRRPQGVAAARSQARRLTSPIRGGPVTVLPPSCRQWLMEATRACHPHRALCLYSLGAPHRSTTSLSPLVSSRRPGAPTPKWAVVAGSQRIALLWSMEALASKDRWRS
jgi:hypothetical protein